jgi:hypothetical protein
MFKAFVQCLLRLYFFSVCRSYGAIVGIAIGCLAGIAVLIALIVVCCNVMNKNRGMTGRVVYPGDPAGGVTVVNTHQHGMHQIDLLAPISIKRERENKP